MTQLTHPRLVRLALASLTRAGLAAILMLPLALHAQAQQRPLAGHPASGSFEADRLVDTERPQRYTFDPETGVPRLTDEATATFFERHRATREGAQAEIARHALPAPDHVRPGPAAPLQTGSQGGGSFTVNTAYDRDDNNPGDGICYTGFLVLIDGVTRNECTLRAAIEEVNATPGTHPYTINFDIGTGPGGSSQPGGVWLIQPLSALPTVTRSNTTLDALSQPGASCGNLASSNPGAPRHNLKVWLYGVLLGGSAHGLAGSIGLGITDITFRGFIVSLFPGYGIVLGGGGSVAECNYVGTNQYGESERANADGILVSDLLLTSTGGLVENNLISGNEGNGVFITRDHVEVRGNLLGTDDDGSQPLGNGTDFSGTWSDIFVSGDDAIIDGNVASSARAYGVYLDESETVFGTTLWAERAVVTNNIFGLSRFRTDTGLGALWVSVLVSLGANDNDIGLPGAGNYAAGGQFGIGIGGTDANNNRVRGNVIGLDGNGNAVPNQSYGLSVSIDIFGGSPVGTVIGGPGPDDGNIIAGNEGYGIRDRRSIATRIEGNTIGLNAAGSMRPNTSTGIHLFGSTDAVVRGNTVSGNEGVGIQLGAYVDDPATGALIENNRIGTTPAGTASRPNGLSGIVIVEEAMDIEIRDNVIAANTDTGLFLDGASDVIAEGNFIGTNASGANLGNGLPGGSGRAGIYCQNASNVRIGLNFSPNTIRFNGADGVFVGAGCADLAVVGNIIRDNRGLALDRAPDGPDAGEMPIITSAENDGTDAVIGFALIGALPNTDYQLLFCRNASADPSGYGECETPNALANVTTNGAGNASGTKTVPAADYPAGSWVTASATITAGTLPQGYGPTSEFAAVVEVEDISVMQPDYDLEATNTSPLTIAPGGQVAFDYSITNNTGAPVEGDLWFTVAPGGFSSVIASGTVQAGQTVNGSFVQQVPGFAPPGDYTYTLHIGQYPGTSVDAEEFIAMVAALDRESGSTNGSTSGSTTWSVSKAAPWQATQTTQAASHMEALPSEAILAAAYPNPFARQTTLSFRLPERDRVTLTVYDVLGREVARLVDGEVGAGHHEAVLDGSDLASGVYVVRLVAGEATQTQRLTLVR